MPGKKKNKNQNKQGEEAANNTPPPQEGGAGATEETATTTPPAAETTQEQQPAAKPQEETAPSTTTESETKPEETTATTTTTETKPTEEEAPAPPPPAPRRKKTPPPPDNGEPDVADPPMALPANDEPLAHFEDPITDIELDFERRIKDLNAIIAIRDAEILDLDQNIGALPTLEEFDAGEKAVTAEIESLEKHIDLHKKSITVLTPVQDRGYALTARLHRLENYCVRCAIWVEETLVADINAEIFDHRRMNELDVVSQIHKNQQAREFQQLAILELKEQIHENSRSLTKGHTRLPRTEYTDFENVPTSRSAGFGRHSVAREEARVDKDTRNLRDVNGEVVDSLITLRTDTNSLHRSKGDLAKELKRLKDQLNQEVGALAAEFHNLESKMNQNRRVAAELENSNGNTASTIEFLMTSLKVLRHGKKAPTASSPAAIAGR